MARLDYSQKRVDFVNEKLLEATKALEKGGVSLGWGNDEERDAVERQLHDWLTEHGQKNITYKEIAYNLDCLEVGQFGS